MNNLAPLLNTRLLKAYASLDQRVVDLVVAIKIWTKEKRLCGAVDGHLSSYAFALMAIYYLQVVSGTSMPCLQKDATDDAFADEESAEKVAQAAREAGWKLDASLFMLVCGFFAFYAGTNGPCTNDDEMPFNWGMEVVSIRLGTREFSSHEEFKELRGIQEERLHIEDPFERSRNLRDVMTQKTERLLFQCISWMDGLCRAVVFEKQSGVSPMPSPMMGPELIPPGVLMPPGCPFMMNPFGIPLMPPMEMLHLDERVPARDAMKLGFLRGKRNSDEGRGGKGKASKGDGAKGSKGDAGKGWKSKGSKGDEGKAGKSKGRKGRDKWSHYFVD